MRRVVITGVGIVSALGIGREQTWKALLDGTSGILPHSFDETWGPVPKLAALIDRSALPPMEELVSPSRRGILRYSSTVVHYSLVAMREALRHAVLDPNTSKTAVGICGGINSFVPTKENDLHLGLQAIAEHAIAPVRLPALMIGGFRGPTFSNIDTCCAGAHAVGQAYDQILFGRADIMLAGAADSLTNARYLSQFNALGALSRATDPAKGCMPFDENRNGTVLGEGAAWLVLEELETAQLRGATPLAEISGYFSGTEDHTSVDPSPDGSDLAQAIRQALCEASVRASDLGYVNVHGTGTRSNDVSEAQALRLALADAFGSVYCGSTKQATGHTNSASGAFETAFTALALESQLIPPHLNMLQPAEIFKGMRFPPSNRAAPHQFGAAMNINLGFGGLYSVLVLKRWQE